MTVPRETSELGTLLEEARTNLRISVREAARRAAISDTRWRQIASGSQPVGGGSRIPVRPTDRTVVAMALAVGVDPSTALRAAGYEPGPALDAIVTEVVAQIGHLQPGRRIGPTSERGRFDLKTEIERIKNLDLPADMKLDMIRTVVDLYEEAGAAQQPPG